MSDNNEVLPDGEKEIEQIFEPIPVSMQKVTARIGDGEGMIFAVEHPQAPFVTVALFRALGGEEVHNPPQHEQGRVVFAFARPPVPEEFIAVVIG